MVNAGAAEGAISASDILKPYLARGDIKCIGATTKKEYEKYFLVDKALSRRFETIVVNEPDEQETFNILKNVKNEYEKFHKVSIKDDTIKILIHLASTYYPNKKNPDKSLELLDSIMSYVKLKTKNNLIKEKELELKRIGINKIKEIENGNFKEALNNNMLENKIKKELNLIKNTNKVFVKDEDLIDVLEYKNNIIISKNKVNIINNRLSKKYSNKIIDLITKTIYKKEGIKSFMFVGDVNDLINDLSKELNYNIIKLSDEKSFENMILKVKYNMGCILLINDNTNNIVKKQIAKIVKDKLYEYNDEYINFNNVIVINNTNKKSVGFENSIISSIPVDEVIILKKVLS
jgi:ATP-dependent Clp protease ATP-binding subunit ClpA